MENSKDTIFATNYYHIKEINDNIYLYDGTHELFKIKKILNRLELIKEMEENESFFIIERFHTIDGNCYLYVADVDVFSDDYLVLIEGE